MSRSKVTIIRWKHEATSNVDMTSKWRFLITTLLLTPSKRNICHRIKVGCPRRPVDASIIAKRVSKMLLLVCSRDLLFTAIITSTLSRTVNGQVMALRMRVMTSLTSRETSAALLSPLVVFEALVKLAKEKFAMSTWNYTANQLCLLGLVIGLSFQF